MYSRNSLRRRASIEKLQRDADNIRRYARFVIVLRNGKPEVTDNGHLRIDGLPYARLIAVLGPVRTKRVVLDESVLLEIGYSRTRPYTQLEERPKSGPRWFLKERVRARTLSDRELVAVYPSIVECMEKVVLEIRESWLTKGRWWIPGPGAVEVGIRFTVSHTDKRLHQQMILEDVRYRKKRYISGHAKRIARLFRHYKYSVYPATAFQTFASAQRVATLLYEQYKSPFYRTILVNHFNRGSHVHALLELVVDAFELHVLLDPQEAVWLETPKDKLPTLHNLFCYRLTAKNQPSVHARHCTVFEICLTRSYREQHEVPF